MNDAITRRDALLGAAATAGSLLLAGGNARAQARPTELRIGITTFLSGAASVFGVPARQAAELLFEEINKAGGIAGLPVRAYFVDEAPGTDHLVGEYRRLVQNEGVYVVFASISSGSCLACTPLSDEMRKTTLLWDCGTQRIFEEGKHPYAFRTQGYGTPEVLAPLLYLLKHKPDFRTLAVINQDYAWGRDSWELWKAAMDALKPGVRVVAEMFPRFGAPDYSTEVTRLLAARPDVILSTSWGGDLVTLVRQASERRLFERSTFVLPVAEASMQVLGRTMPAGHVIGARGDHWNNHPQPKDPARLAKFVDAYRAKYNEYPIYPCHHMAQAISALQAGLGRAIQAKGGGWPNDLELANAFRGLTFDTPTSSITLREDGQGLEDQIVGLSSFNDRFPFAVPRDMIMFPAAMVSTPVGQKSVDWLKTLKPEMLAQVPAPIAG
ncbi:ABC transporter substrate-binding protein [Paracraurococcus ruber]|uniref:Branched-chain amino acid ABC transporter substrate-binding protein n=1 Tax=Paracraurococcus ruber TaxID=77675 RepID=A0ABS1CYH5_9PROT|nr:ABC transporter substrate-binding protein [Paracraurococcus ruber]MBK1658759.1 branched-chain amino acid ABC transporter substrate-binding protein [Paracraurococcus ruber]TDG32059.1 branched-chain amino acid ABC transporter substrate-binding protein [Paracraurococcus ruber]